MFVYHAASDSNEKSQAVITPRTSPWLLVLMVPLDPPVPPVTPSINGTPWLPLCPPWLLALMVPLDSPRAPMTPSINTVLVKKSMKNYSITCKLWNDKKFIFQVHLSNTPTISSSPLLKGNLHRHFIFTGRRTWEISTVHSYLLHIIVIWTWSHRWNEILNEILYLKVPSMAPLCQQWVNGLYKQTLTVGWVSDMASGHCVIVWSSDIIPKYAHCNSVCILFMFLWAGELFNVWPLVLDMIQYISFLTWYDVGLRWYL